MQGRTRRASKRRARRSLIDVVRDLSPREFQNAFRTPKDTFEQLHIQLCPALERDVLQGLRSSEGSVKLDVRLAVLLRMWAGASYLDTIMLFGLSSSTVYDVCHATSGTILEHFTLPGLPFEDKDDLDQPSRGFSDLGVRVNPLMGCVGALEGIAIKIRKPKGEYIPRNYYCRKAYYAVHFQALVDARYHFLCLSSVVCGSTHDSLAYSTLSFGHQMSTRGLPIGYWIAGDAAYVCTESILVRFSVVQLQHSELGVWSDSYNFYEISLRVHVEQSFGVSVSRFGVLWRPLAFDLNRSSHIVYLCALLHNYIIDNAPPGSTRPLNGFEDLHGSTGRQYTEEAFRRWWRGSQNMHSGAGAGTRNNLAHSTHRDLLVNRLMELGLTRPRSELVPFT